MNGWPYISRARVIRFSLFFALLCLAFAGLYVVLALTEVSGAPDRVSWIPVVLWGGLGLLALLGVWAARRDQAREDAAGDRTSPEQR